MTYKINKRTIFVYPGLRDAQNINICLTKLVLRFKNFFSLWTLTRAVHYIVIDTDSNMHQPFCIEIYIVT